MATMTKLGFQRWTVPSPYPQIRYLCRQEFLSHHRWKCSPSDTIPPRAQVVICGGGVVGSSVAYHLPKYGFKDVIHVEQGSLGCGTTWHSAGLLGAIRGSRAHTKLTMYSNELYSKLEEETGFATGIKQTGNLTLATTKERMTVLRRQQAVGRSLGIESEIVSAEECTKICPLIKTDDVIGALYVMDDLSAGDPGDICRSLSRGAQLQGVRLYEGVCVEGIKVRNGRVAGVKSNRGDIECEIFVNCSGQWARQLGALSNPKVNIPLYSTGQLYFVTEPFEDFDPRMPTIRDQDNALYIRQWGGGILTGIYDGKPCFQNGVPDSFEFQLLPEDMNYCELLSESLMNRIPSINTVGIIEVINGPESITPDLHAIMGEAPEFTVYQVFWEAYSMLKICNYFVGAGMNSTGIATAGGFGRALSEWIYLGEPPFDLWEFDIARFSSHSANLSYLNNQAKETLAHHYSIPWPKLEMESGRRIKMTPFHTRLEEAGASWGCIAGWERPNWFSGTERACNRNSLTFGRPNYFDYVREEHLACRENVVLFDLTSLVKLKVEGADACDALQKICSNNVNVSIGQVVYTGMLNRKGGYQTDCTVTRMDEQRFLAICPASQHCHITAWLNKHIPSTVKVTNITSHFCVLGLMGPRSRELLKLVTKTPLENERFPYGTSQIIEIELASNIRALQVSDVGELGWELHIPMEYALHVYDGLMEKGKMFGLKLAGSYAMDSLRIEKGYCHWGHELDCEMSPLNTRLMHTVDFKKGDFIGREALLKQKAQGVTQMLGTFKVNIPLEDDTFPWGKEIIYRNGIRAGYVTSASYGYSVNSFVCMGYVNSSNGEKISTNYLREGKYEIEIDGSKYPAELTTESFYDPHQK